MPLPQAINPSRAPSIGPNQLLFRENQTPKGLQQHSDEGLHPDLLDLKYADFPIEDLSHPVVRAMFSPESLSPSKKPSNITIHLSMEDWISILVMVNTSGETLDDTAKIIDKLNNSLKIRSESLAAKIENTDSNIADWSKISKNIKTADRFYGTPASKNYIKFNDLQHQILEAKAEKKQLQSQLNGLKFHEKNKFKELNEFIDLIWKNKYQSTILILKLIRAKFEPDEENFSKILYSNLRIQGHSWVNPPTKIIEFIDEWSGSVIFEPYEYFHDVQEKNLKYADCIETTIRNFLAIIAALKPPQQSHLSWFHDLQMEHLLYDKNGEPNHLLEFLSGPDSVDKHERFASLLRELGYFSPERRKGGCIVSEKKLFKHLDALLKQNSLVLLKKMNLPYEMDNEESELIINAPGGAEYQVVNDYNHGYINKKHLPPSIFLSPLEGHVANEMTPLILMSCSKKVLETSLDDFWSHSSKNDFIPTIQVWSQAIEEIAPSIFRDILSFTEEKKEIFLDEKMKGTSLKVSHLIAALEGKPKEFFYRAKIGGFRNYWALKVSNFEERQVQNAINAKLAGFDSRDAITIANLTSAEREVGMQAMRDGFLSQDALKLAKLMNLKPLVYKIVESGIGKNYAIQFAQRGEEVGNLAIKAKKIGIKDYEFFAIAKDFDPIGIKVILEAVEKSFLLRHAKESSFIGI